MRDVCKVLHFETCLGSNKDAAADVRVLLIGNPCNTNCLIAMNNAKEIPRHRWFAMTRLDENRARAACAQSGHRDHARDEHDDLGQSFLDPGSGFLQCEDRQSPGLKVQQDRPSLDFAKVPFNLGVAPVILVAVVFGRIS
jgi:hypothetical protein